MKTIHTRNHNNRGNKIEVTVDVIENKEVLFSQVINVLSKKDFDNRLGKILKEANKVDLDFSLLVEGEWEAPVSLKESVPATPSVEEQTATDIETERAKLRGAKNDLELGLIDQSSYDANLAEVKTKLNKLTKAK